MPFKIRSPTIFYGTILPLSISPPENTMISHPLSGQLTPSTPDLTCSESPSLTRTNTIVITSLPMSFFEPVVLEALRTHFASYGDVHTWAPLKAFARIFVIYYDEEAAEMAKETCDNLRVEESEARSVLLPFREAPLFTPLLFQPACRPASVPRRSNASGTTGQSESSAPSCTRKELPHISSRFTTGRLGADPRRASQQHTSC